MSRPSDTETGKSATSRRLIIGLASAAGLTGFIWLIAQYWPGGVDYYSTFYPNVHRWLFDGAALYDGSNVSLSYHHPPWTVLGLTPFALLPYDLSQALLIVCTVGVLIASMLTFTRPGRIRLLVLFVVLGNLHTFDLLFRAQITGFAVLGVMLGWIAYDRHRPWLMGLAYLSLMMVPPNTIPPAVLLLALTLRRWKPREVLTSLSAPAALFVASFAIFPGWPARWYSVYSSVRAWEGSGWVATIWRAQEQLGLNPVVPWLIMVITVGLTIYAWTRAQHRATTSTRNLDLFCYLLIISAWYVVSPYVIGYRLVVILVTVMPFLASWWPPTAVLAYAVSLSPLLRLVIGIENTWVDVALPLLLFVLMLIMAPRLSAQRSPL